MPAPDDPPFTDPLNAELVGGEVVVTHPSTSVAVSMTRDAARESARRLVEAADQRPA